MPTWFYQPALRFFCGLVRGYGPRQPLGLCLVGPPQTCDLGLLHVECAGPVFAWYEKTGMKLPRFGGTGLASFLATRLLLVARRDDGP